MLPTARRIRALMITTLLAEPALAMDQPCHGAASRNSGSNSHCDPAGAASSMTDHGNVGGRKRGRSPRPEALHNDDPAPAALPRRRPLLPQTTYDPTPAAQEALDPPVDAPPAGEGETIDQYWRNVVDWHVQNQVPSYLPWPSFHAAVMAVTSVSDSPAIAAYHVDFKQRLQFHMLREANQRLPEVAATNGGLQDQDVYDSLALASFEAVGTMMRDQAARHTAEMENQDTRHAAELQDQATRLQELEDQATRHEAEMTRVREERDTYLKSERNLRIILESADRTEHELAVARRAGESLSAELVQTRDAANRAALELASERAERQRYRVYVNEMRGETYGAIDTMRAVVLLSEDRKADLRRDLERYPIAEQRARRVAQDEFERVREQFLQYVWITQDEYDHLHDEPEYDELEGETTQAGGAPSNEEVESPAGEPPSTQAEESPVDGEVPVEDTVEPEAYEQPSTESASPAEDELSEANEPQSEDTDSVTRVETNHTTAVLSTENAFPDNEQTPRPETSEPQSEHIDAGMTRRESWDTDRSEPRGLPAWAIAIIVAVSISFVLTGAVVFYMYRRGSLPCCHRPNISTGTGDLTTVAQDSLLEEGAIGSTGGVEAEPQRGPESGPGAE